MAPWLLAAFPGAMVVAAAAAGWVPQARDLPTYFVPLRYYTGLVLSGHRAPFWNPQVGCGEPFFANPQSGLLYPPAWFAAVLPSEVAVGVEVGVHLLVLALGCYRLARRLGAPPALAGGAGLACACAGPVASAAGVLNNLETLAWLPWMWEAAAAGSLAGVAATTALAWLGAEPTLTAVGAGVALALAPHRRTVGGVALAGCAVAVQVLPFVFWVAGGDRGPGSAAQGAVAPLPLASLWRLVVPAPLPAGASAFLENLALPVWAVLLGLVALQERGTVRRRLAVCGWALALAAVLPALPLGEVAWRWATAGLVRHPLRLLFPATLALIVAAAACPRRTSRMLAGALGGGGALVALAGGASPLAALLGGAAVVAVVGGVAPTAGVVAGAVALLPSAAASLHLRPAAPTPVAPCLEAQQAAARVYLVEPSQRQAAWVAAGWPERGHALGWGYTPLLDGRNTARTFAPLQSRRLAAHLEAADRGPTGRWWLDALGADLVLSAGGVRGFPEGCASRGMVAQPNPGAWPLTFVAIAIPAPGEAPVKVGEVVSAVVGKDSAEWEVVVGEGGGVLVRLATPDPGWRFTVDGQAVPVRQGSGILHGVAVPAGRHRVRASYRPPGFGVGLLITVLGCGVLMGGVWRRW